MKFGTAKQPTQASIEATITRADGTVEHLGTVDYYHKNPLYRLWWRLLRILGYRGRFWR